METSRKSITNNTTWAKVQGNWDEWQILEWKVKIPVGLQPTANFFHIHQLKAQDGPNNGAPTITITPRASSSGSNKRIQISDTWSASLETATSRLDAGPPDMRCCGTTEPSRTWETSALTRGTRLRRSRGVATSSGFGNAPGASPDAPRFRAWLWTERDDIRCQKLPGTDLCDLGTLDVNGTAEAWGVNERGQVVGTSCPPSGPCKAFLWEHGEMKDLNASKGAYPHHLENAMDINNKGQITGRARTSSGFEAFLATPTPRR